VSVARIVQHQPDRHSCIVHALNSMTIQAMRFRLRAQAGPAIANQVSNANPFASQSPAAAPLPCATFVTRSPWGVPALLFGQAPGLLTADNSTYSDATLCCGGVLDFTWTVHVFLSCTFSLSDSSSIGM